MNMDKNTISREALAVFQRLYYGTRTPREMSECLGRLETDNEISAAEYDAIMLADWRELGCADPDWYRTREEIAAEAVRREELDCAFTELATARGRIESIITKSLARLGGKFEVPTGKSLWAHVFNGETCDETAHEVCDLYTTTGGDVYAMFCDGYRDLPFFENCTEPDLMTLADLLVNA